MLLLFVIEMLWKLDYTVQLHTNVGIKMLVIDNANMLQYILYWSIRVEGFAACTSENADYSDWGHVFSALTFQVDKILILFHEQKKKQLHHHP